MTAIKPRSLAQNSEFYELIIEAKFDDDQKDMLVMTVSTNRTKKSSELSFEEMQAAIAKLRKSINDTANKRRSRIVAVARQIGYVDGGDYKRLNEFIMKHFKCETIFKVPLDRLSDVITAIERVKSWKESKALEGQLA
jgi:hypothetical protein